MSGSADETATGTVDTTTQQPTVEAIIQIIPAPPGAEPLPTAAFAPLGSEPTGAGTAAPVEDTGDATVTTPSDLETVTDGDPATAETDGDNSGGDDQVVDLGFGSELTASGEVFNVRVPQVGATQVSDMTVTTNTIALNLAADGTGSVQGDFSATLPDGSALDFVVDDDFSWDATRQDIRVNIVATVTVDGEATQSRTSFLSMANIEATTAAINLNTGHTFTFTVNR